jgi:hypothetical protein
MQWHLIACMRDGCASNSVINHRRAFAHLTEGFGCFSLTVVEIPWLKAQLPGITIHFVPTSNPFHLV